MANDVNIKVGADTSAVAAGMAQLRGYVNETVTQVSGQFASMFAVGTVIEFGKQIIEFGARIEDLSRRYGVGTEAIQKYGRAAELTGSSLEAMAMGLGRFEIAQSKALGGDQKMIETFGRLGVTFQDLMRLSPEQLIEKISHSSMNAADMVKIFGKNALALIPAFQGIADGSIPVGKGIDDNIIKKLKEADDRIKIFSQNAKIAFAEVTAGFLDSQKGLERFNKEGPRPLFDKRSWTPHGWDEKDAPKLLKSFTIDQRAPRNRGGGDGGATDDFGNLTGGGGNTDNLRDRFSKMQEESLLKLVPLQEKLRALEADKKKIVDDYVNSVANGAAEEGAYYKTSIAAMGVQKEIDATQKEITDEHKKQFDAQQKLHEQAIQKAEDQADNLRGEREKTDILRAELHGHKDLADRLKIIYDYDDKIRKALKEGDVNTANELKNQKGIALALHDQVAALEEKAALEKAEAERLAKLAEGYQTFTDNAASLSPQDTLATSAAQTINKLKDAYGANFGTHGPGGGPNFLEQQIIRAHDLAGIEAFQRSTPATPSFTAQSLARTGFASESSAEALASLKKITDTLSAMLIEQRNTVHRLTPPPGSG